MSENENNQDLNQPVGSTPDNTPVTDTTDKWGDTVNENVNSFNNGPSVGESEQPSPGTQAQTPPNFAPQYPPYMGGQYQYPQQRPQPPTYYNNPTQPYYVPPQYAASAQFGNVPPPPTKGKRKGLKIFFAVLSVLVVFSIILSGVAIAIGNDKLTVKGNDGTTSTTNDGPELNINNTPADSSNSSGKTGVLTPVEVAEKAKPSVVGILTYSGQTDSATGEGSGIIMGTDETGKYTYIITCAHVISDAGVSISIQLEDGTQYKAERVGYDVRTDVGVVKIKKTGLPAATFGNSDALKVGEQVFAVGNPGGTEFFGSFTAGMVSAIDRPVDSEIGYTMELIQHDAAINPGNSGGALVNTYGQVIGMNSLKIIDTNYEGMGFAIPITSAKSIVDSIIKYGYVPNRPKLGITYLAASSSQAYSMIVQIKGLPSGSLYINDINPDSNLAKTKALAGDLIIAVNGKNLDTASVLLEVIDKGKVGDTLTLTLCRVSSNYQTSEFDVKVQLVEDKGNYSPISPTTEATTNPFDYFNNPWGN